MGGDCCKPHPCRLSSETTQKTSLKLLAAGREEHFMAKCSKFPVLDGLKPSVTIWG